MMVDPTRPFRHLCHEADLRDAMTDDEFWAHVDDSIARVSEEYSRWIESWSDPEEPEVQISTSCPVCGDIGACGYDVDGRPWIHVEEEADR